MNSSLSRGTVKEGAVDPSVVVDLPLFFFGDFYKQVLLDKTKYSLAKNRPNGGPRHGVRGFFGDRYTTKLHIPGILRVVATGMSRPAIAYTTEGVIDLRFFSTAPYLRYRVRGLHWGA